MIIIITKIIELPSKLPEDIGMIYSSTHSLWKGRLYFHGYYMIDHKRILHMLGVVTYLGPNAQWWGIEAVLRKSKSCVFWSPMCSGIRCDGIDISLRTQKAWSTRGFPRDWRCEVLQRFGIGDEHACFVQLTVRCQIASAEARFTSTCSRGIAIGWLCQPMQ